MPPSEAPQADTTLVAILRGVVPDRVVAVADALYGAGIRAIEVPLNSPDPYASVAALAAWSRPGSLIGAGTVLNADQVRLTREAGGRLVVAPNCDAAVIAAALGFGMQCMPGFATASEAFAALRAGARQLKLFPAISHGPQHLRALFSVLPPDTRVYPVGGIGAKDIAAWLAAGAAGFGFGSEIFRPEYSLAEIERRADELVQALAQARRSLDQQRGAVAGLRTTGERV